MKKKFYTWEECMQLREVKVSYRQRFVALCNIFHTLTLRV